MIGNDNQTIGAACRGAWRWWTRELADMAPATWTARAGLARILIGDKLVRIERQIGGLVEIHADERRIEDLDEAGWDELLGLIDGLSTEIILEHPRCWTGEVYLPKAARSRLQSAVELQLPHIAPLPEEMLCWKASVRADLGDELLAAIPMAKRSFVEELDALFASHGRATPPIFARASDADRKIRNGVRRANREATGPDRLLVASVAMVCAIPLVTAFLAIFLTSMTHDQIEALEVRLAPKIEAEAVWRKDEAVRRAIAEMSKSPTATDILGRLDVHVPKGVELTSLSLEQGKRLSVTARAESAQSVQQAFDQDPSLGMLRPVGEVPQDGRLFLVTLESGGG